MGSIFLRMGCLVLIPDTSSLFMDLGKSLYSHFAAVFQRCISTLEREIFSSTNKRRVVNSQAVVPGAGFTIQGEMLKCRYLHVREVLELPYKTNDGLPLLKRII